MPKVMAGGKGGDRARTPQRRRSSWEPEAPPKSMISHIDASLSRQPLVKGERLVRYEVNAVMPEIGESHLYQRKLDKLSLCVRLRLLHFVAAAEARDRDPEGASRNTCNYCFKDGCLLQQPPRLVWRLMSTSSDSEVREAFKLRSVYQL